MRFCWFCHEAAHFKGLLRSFSYHQGPFLIHQGPFLVHPGPFLYTALYGSIVLQCYQDDKSIPPILYIYCTIGS